MPLSKVKPENYQTQLNQKAERIQKQFNHFSPPALSVYTSEPLHYRSRAEFKVWHDGDDSYYAMFRPETPKQPYRIDDFPIGSVLLNQLMSSVMDAVKRQPILRTRLFQAEFLTTLSGQGLVTLIYHKKLTREWELAATALQETLNISIIGRSRKQKIVLKKDYVVEKLHVNQQHYYFQQVEGSFTQPNAGVNQKMLSWALEQSKQCGGDLVELYCGNGNFTAVLAQNFKQVLATEISKTSVRSAHTNFKLNKIDNVFVARMSSEEFSNALLGTRTFRRLEGINLNHYDFSTILVDPPRAGLDDQTIALISRFEHIIYISCNPNTLHENLNSICKTHYIDQFAIFDQFPYTDHIECGVILKKITQT